jgi:hypothetical protein
VKKKTQKKIFPNLFLMMEGIQEQLIKILPKRADNMSITAHNPQEEEYALCALSPHSYYHCFMFPQQQQALFDKYLLLHGLEASEYEQMKCLYLAFLKKLSYANGHKQLLLKNPVNTARIRFLLELFPDAKFIHISRNPFEIYASSVKLFQNIFEQFALQTYSKHQIEAFVLKNYKEMMANYLNDRHLIPAGNLIEIKFEDFKQAPLDQLRKIYTELQLPNFTEVEGKFQSYLATVQDYEQNSYKFSPEVIEVVKQNWAFAFEAWNYSWDI